MRSSYWLYQPSWFVDPTNGNDEWTGDSNTHTSGLTGPVKTVTEVHRRRGPRAWKQDTTITILGDLPTSDPFILDEPRGNFLTSYIGQPTTVTTGTLTGFTLRNPATNQANVITTATTLGTRLGSSGYQLKMTSGLANGGVFYVAKDLTGSYRISSVSSPTTGFQTSNPPANGDSFVVRTLPAVPVAKIQQMSATRFDSLRLGGTKLRVQGSELLDTVVFANCVLDEVVFGEFSSNILACCLTSANTSEGAAYPFFLGGYHFFAGGIVFGARMQATRNRMLELGQGTLLQGATVSPHHFGRVLIDDAGIFDATLDASGAAINTFNGEIEIITCFGSGSTYGMIIDSRSKVSIGSTVGTTPTVTGTTGDVLMDDTLHSWSEFVAGGSGAGGGGVISVTGQGAALLGAFGPNG